LRELIANNAALDEREQTRTSLIVAPVVLAAGVMGGACHSPQRIKALTTRPAD
jgi:hypothetical protein